MIATQKTIIDSLRDENEQLRQQLSEFINQQEKQDHEQQQQQGPDQSNPRSQSQYRVVSNTKKNKAPRTNVGGASGNKKARKKEENYAFVRGLFDERVLDDTVLRRMFTHANGDVCRTADAVIEWLESPFVRFF